MEKRSFRITVNGELYDVEVEEVGKMVGSAVSNDSVNAGKRDTIVKDLVENLKPETLKEQESKNEKPEVALKSVAKGTVISAPMPGAIVDIMVKEGENVKQDDVLIILEAMKMENEITSPVSGTVTQILVSKGASVNSKEKLLVIE